MADEDDFVLEEARQRNKENIINYGDYKVETSLERAERIEVELQGIAEDYEFSRSQIENIDIILDELRIAVDVLDVRIRVDTQLRDAGLPTLFLDNSLAQRQLYRQQILERGTQRREHQRLMEKDEATRSDFLRQQTHARRPPLNYL